LYSLHGRLHQKGRAAMQAVQQWQYKHTLLNGEPVVVITTIDVNFTLSQ